MGGLCACLGSVAGGEAPFKWQWQNIGATNTYLGLTNHLPGNLIPIDVRPSQRLRSTDP
jgi:hypothetical protein